ncbi:MAG: EF-hand domain-containing protein [Marinosulfonomonas sp.]|nr:EF-hand domain-containing protein [Marinosulfonomonas sp.]
MKRILLLSAAIALGSAAIAQQGNPGAHFIENWDANEDGQVTLAEATEKRSDIFFTFDEDDSGFLSASDYAMFDEARANDQANMEQSGQGYGAGKGQQGQGMTLEFNDVDGDGKVSRDEFMARAPDWFATKDRNGDGVITTADFGPRN